MFCLLHSDGIVYSDSFRQIGGVAWRTRVSLLSVATQHPTLWSSTSSIMVLLWWPSCSCNMCRKWHQGNLWCAYQAHLRFCCRRLDQTVVSMGWTACDRFAFSFHGHQQSLCPEFRGGAIWMKHWQGPWSSAGNHVSGVAWWFVWAGLRCNSVWLHWPSCKLGIFVRWCQLWMAYGLFKSGVLTRWKNVELFAIPPTLSGGLYAGPPEGGESVECCRILAVPTPPILDNYTNCRAIDAITTKFIFT